MKTRKMFSFSEKHVANGREFLRENLKAKAKLKNMKSQECYEKYSEKKSIYIYIYIIYI